MKKISRKIGNELEDFVGAISDSSKADKVSSSTAGDLASLNSSGNLEDSGISAANVITAVNHALAKGTPNSLGLYKITTNAEGHVIDAVAATDADIIALGFSKTGTVPVNPQSTADLNIWIET